jgi:hypothetical protein
MSQHIQQLTCWLSPDPFLARVTIQNIELIELARKSTSFDDLQKLFALNTKMVEQICNESTSHIDS